MSVGVPCAKLFQKCNLFVLHVVLISIFDYLFHLVSFVQFTTQVHRISFIAFMSLFGRLTMSLSKMWQPTLFGKAPTEEKYVSNPSNQNEKFMNKYFEIHGDAGKNRKDLSRYGQKRNLKLELLDEKKSKVYISYIITNYS